MGTFQMNVKGWKWAVAVFFFLSYLSSSPVYAQGTSLIRNTNLDGSQTLPSHVPLEVTKGLATKISPVDPGQLLNLRLLLPSRDPAGLDSFVHDLYDPKSPNYHKFITPAQFALMFGASPLDTSIVTEYIKSQGLTVLSQSQNGFILRVTGPVSKVESAFKVNIGKYRRLSNGTTFFAPDVNPTVPPQLAGRVYEIAGMDSAHKYYPHFHQKKFTETSDPLAIKTVLNPQLKKGSSPAPAFSGPDGTIAPSDLYTAYNINTSSSNGGGQTLALFELDGFVAGDITHYTSQFNLTEIPPISVVSVDGGIPTVGEGIGEVDLDIDMVISLAPGLSSILVYEAPNDDTGTGWIEEWDRIISDDSAQIVSVSWGSYEQGLDQYGHLNGYDHSVFQQLATEGITVFAAAGDSGAYDNCSNATLQPQCTDPSTGDTITPILSVDDPASDPYITGVGISILSVNGSEGWSGETASPQGGGGVSSYWPITNTSAPPSYSYQVAAATSYYNATSHAYGSITMRNVPDVVLTAGPTTQYWIWISDPLEGTGWYTVWGSSAASPLWAAFMARVNQGRVAAGETVVGFVDPLLYQIGQSSDYNTDFHNITTGNNSYYPATTGYNDASGLGSFNGQYLYNELIGPAAPTGLNATPGNMQVSLSWTASAGAVSYNVQRSTVSGGPYTTISTSGAVTSANYTDSNVTNGTLYYYVVNGVNAAGIAGANSSPPASATPVGLSAPTGLTASPGNANVALTWTASAQATWYNVKRATVSGGPYTTISTSGAVTTSSYPDSSVTNGTTYYYVVSAANSGYESANSSEVSATPLAPPLAPTGVNATAGNTQVELTWTASATAASYNVQRSTISGSGYTTVSTTGAVVGPSYTDSGLTNATPYYYVISAVNVGGTSPNSSPEVTATPIATLPLAPTGLDTTVSNAQVALTWTASANTTSYNVFRSTLNGGPFTMVSTPATVTSPAYTDNSVTNGTTYYYEVNAVNGVGAGANSPQASATPLAPPLAPTGLIATSGNAQAVLNWTASATATSYNVKRSTVNGGPYTTVSTSGAVTTNTYTDTPLTNGTTYYYVVSAVNSGGESPNSTQSSVVPVPPIASPTNLQVTIQAARVGSQIIEGNVILTWGQSASAGVTQNKIYRSSGSGGFILLNTTGATTSYTDGNMPKGTTYTYEVTASNSTAESLASNTVTINY